MGRPLTSDKPLPCFKEIMRNNGQSDPTRCIAAFFMNEETNSIWSVMWIFILVSFWRLSSHIQAVMWYQQVM